MKIDENMCASSKTSTKKWPTEHESHEIYGRTWNDFESELNMKSTVSFSSVFLMVSFDIIVSIKNMASDSIPSAHSSISMPLVWNARNCDKNIAKFTLNESSWKYYERERERDNEIDNINSERNNVNLVVAAILLLFFYHPRNSWFSHAIEYNHDFLH